MLKIIFLIVAICWVRLAFSGFQCHFCEKIINTTDHICPYCHCCTEKTEGLRKWINSFKKKEEPEIIKKAKDYLSKIVPNDRFLMLNELYPKSLDFLMCSFKDVHGWRRNYLILKLIATLFYSKHMIKNGIDPGFKVKNIVEVFIADEYQGLMEQCCSEFVEMGVLVRKMPEQISICMDISSFLDVVERYNHYWKASEIVMRKWRPIIIDSEVKYDSFAHSVGSEWLLRTIRSRSNDESESVVKENVISILTLPDSGKISTAQGFISSYIQTITTISIIDTDDESFTDAAINQLYITPVIVIVYKKNDQENYFLVVHNVGSCALGTSFEIGCGGMIVKSVGQIMLRNILRYLWVLTNK